MAWRYGFLEWWRAASVKKSSIVRALRANLSLDCLAFRVLSGGLVRLMATLQVCLCRLGRLQPEAVQNSR